MNRVPGSGFKAQGSGLKAQGSRPVLQVLGARRSHPSHQIPNSSVTIVTGAPTRVYCQKVMVTC